jgi:hypothetical protein
MDIKILLDFELNVNGTTVFLRDAHYFIAKCSSILNTALVLDQSSIKQQIRSIKKDNKCCLFCKSIKMIYTLVADYVVLLSIAL